MSWLWLVIALVHLVVAGCGDAERERGAAETIAIELNGVDNGKLPTFANIESEDAGSEERYAETGARSPLTPDSMVVVISGCASGFVGVFNTITVGTHLNFFRYDRNCVASLRSFVWNGSLWTKEDGGDFSGSGSTPFVTAGTANRLWVTNPERLSSPLRESDRVSFAVQQILAGNDKLLLVPGARGTQASQNGDRAGPFLQWFSKGGTAGLVDILPYSTPSARAVFRIKQECQGLFNKKTQIKNSTCKVGSTIQTLTNFYYRIVEDRYNGTPTRDQLVAMFGGSSPPTNQPGVVAIKSNSQQWGVSGTATGGVIVNVTTDGSVRGCRNYLVVTLNTNRYSATSYWSFTWHNLDYATDRSSCP
jgi:hypothetical protein